jgi:hypothetical protein
MSEIVDFQLKLVTDPEQEETLRVIALKEFLQNSTTNTMGILLLTLINTKSNNLLQELCIEEIKKRFIEYPLNLQGIFQELLFENEMNFYPKRAIIATLLGRLKEHRAMEYLLKVAKDRTEDRFVRGSAIEALGETNYHPAVPYFLECLSDIGEPLRVKNAAAMSLGWMKEVRAIPILFRLLVFSETELSMAALDAIDNFNTPDITLLLLKFYSGLDRTHHLSSDIESILLQRDILGVITLKNREVFPTIKELILLHGRSNFTRLEKMREENEGLPLCAFLDEVLEKLQPSMIIAQGFRLLL